MRCKVRTRAVRFPQRVTISADVFFQVAPCHAASMSLPSVLAFEKRNAGKYCSMICRCLFRNGTPVSKISPGCCSSACCAISSQDIVSKFATSCRMPLKPISAMHMRRCNNDTLGALLACACSVVARELAALECCVVSRVLAALECSAVTWELATLSCWLVDVFLLFHFARGCASSVARRFIACLEDD